MDLVTDLEIRNHKRMKTKMKMKIMNFNQMAIIALSQQVWMG